MRQVILHGERVRSDVAATPNEAVRRGLVRKTHIVVAGATNPPSDNFLERGETPALFMACSLPRRYIHKVFQHACREN